MIAGRPIGFGFRGDGDEAAVAAIKHAVHTTERLTAADGLPDLTVTKTLHEAMRRELQAREIPFAWSECYLDRQGRIAIAVKFGETPLIVTVIP